MRNIKAAFCAAVAVVAGIWFAQAQAQSAYPDRPIQLIIPFAPGDTDQMLRPITDRMGEFLGQPVVLNYKPGAAGAIGAEFVAKSKPDGYTLVGSSPSSLVVVPLVNENVHYTTDSFTPIMALSEGAMILVVPADSPYKTIHDVVEKSKSDPESMTYGSSGAKGIPNLIMDLFAQKADIKFRHIPFEGSGPAVMALLGKHIDMACSAVAPIQAHIKAGKLRPLAVFNDVRLKTFPDVPTFKELGYDIGSPQFYGIVAAKGTPKEIVDALYAAARKVVDKYGAQIEPTLEAAMGAQVRLVGPQEYQAYLQQQARLYSDGIKSLYH